MIFSSSLTEEETMMTNKRSVEQSVCDTHRRTRKKYSAEEKLRIVLEELRSVIFLAELSH